MNMKKIIIILVSVIILIIGVLLWGYFNSDKEVINDTNEIIPEEEISDTQLRNTIVLLYFINKDTGEIETESKLIDVKQLLNNPCSELIKMWLNGSNNDKYINYCSKNVKINNVEVNDGIAVIDFSKEFVEEYSGKDEDVPKMINCLVNVLTELTEIEYVKILIDGNENIYLGNLNLSEKYCRINN